jgi:hypothetical protein
MKRSILGIGSLAPAVAAATGTRSVVGPSYRIPTVCSSRPVNSHPPVLNV